jgi:hypothetical protein
MRDGETQNLESDKWIRAKLKEKILLAVDFILNENYSTTTSVTRVVSVELWSTRTVR